MLKLKFAKEQLELYLVTDSNLVAPENFEAAIEQAIQGGVTMVQLREKNLSFQDFVAKAKKIKQICHQYNVPLIINDNLDVALAIDSDGIHIGQNDLPATLVRQKIGPDKILGVSTHNLDEALKAKQDGANYLGAGAMFSTATKQDATNLPISKLQKITTNIDLPVVAIGGINEDNCLQLKNCHLAGIAVVSAIMAKKDIKKAAKELKNKAKDLYD